MLHTIRHIINDDEKWRSILTGLNRDFWHQTVTTQQIESYISEKSGIDLSKVFDQYLRTTNIPVLQYKIDGKSVSFRYDKVVKGFTMPVRAIVNGKDMLLTPGETLQVKQFPEPVTSFEVDRNFYLETARL